MIEMYCDRCDKLVEPDVNGGVRLKLGKKEYVFHLCDPCQGLLLKEIKKSFADGNTWREV